MRPPEPQTGWRGLRTFSHWQAPACKGLAPQPTRNAGGAH